MEWSRQRKIIVVVVAATVILASASAYLVLTAEDEDPRTYLGRVGQSQEVFSYVKNLGTAWKASGLRWTRSA